MNRFSSQIPVAFALATLALPASCARRYELDGPVGVSTVTAGGLPRAEAKRATRGFSLELPTAAREVCGIAAPSTIPIQDGTEGADPEARVAFARLATCLLAGGLRQARLAIIGHSVSTRRNEQDLADGLRYASRLKQLFVDRGIPGDRISIASSTDAMPSADGGVDDTPRVEILIARAEPAPASENNSESGGIPVGDLRTMPSSSSGPFRASTSAPRPMAPLPPSHMMPPMPPPGMMPPHMMPPPEMMVPMPPPMATPPMPPPAPAPPATPAPPPPAPNGGR